MVEIGYTLLLIITRFSPFVFFGPTCPEAPLLILGLLFLRAGGHNGIELGILRETVNKRNGHISEEQKALAGIGVGHIGKLVGADTQLLRQNLPVSVTKAP